jgi:hypothetical protein
MHMMMMINVRIKNKTPVNSIVLAFVDVVMNGGVMVCMFVTCLLFERVDSRIDLLQIHLHVVCDALH